MLACLVCFTSVGTYGYRPIDDDCQVEKLAQDRLRIANEEQCIHSSYTIPRMASQSEQAGCKCHLFYSCSAYMPMQIV